MIPPRPPGPEFHTFTAIARCPKTGRLGIATATRSLAVGARVPFVKPRLGAIAIMAIADARLGLMAEKLLEIGYKAPAVIEQLVAGDPYAEYRQLGVIDDDGFGTSAAERDDWEPRCEGCAGLVECGEGDCDKKRCLCCRDGTVRTLPREQQSQRMRVAA